MTRTRLLIAAFLLLPALFFSWLTLTENGLSWALQQAQTHLPENLSWQNIEGDLTGPITVKDIEFQQDGLIIRAKEVRLDWTPMALLAANINISQLHVRELSIVLPKTEAVDVAVAQGKSPPITLPEISLPLRLVLKDVEVDGFSLSQNDQVYTLNKVSLNASTVFSNVKIKQLNVNADSFSINVKGGLQPTSNYQHALDINWQITLPNREILKGDGQLSGNMKSTRITQNLSGPLQLTLDATVNNLLEQLNWTLKTDISQFDITRFNTDLPALTGAANIEANGDLSSARLSGKLHGRQTDVGLLDAEFNLQWLDNNTLQINRLALQVPEKNTRLDAQGLWAPGVDVSNTGGDIKLSLNWQNLHWPMSESPWFYSANGNGSISGNINAYQLIVTTDSPWPQAAPSTWHASAKGNLDGMNIQALRIEALGGEASISGQLNWSPQLNWQVSGNITNVDSTNFLEDWPGQLNASVNSNGRMDKDQLIIQGEIAKLEGTLRGYPVTLHSRVTWSNDQLDIAQFDFTSGKSRLTLKGNLGEKLGLDWSISSDDMAELYPQTQGQLLALGKVSGPRLTPLVEADFKGKNLSYPTVAVASLEGAFAVDLFHWQKVAIKLQAETLSLNDYQLHALNITADNTAINAQASSDDGNVKLALNGEANVTGWRGQLTRLDIETSQFDNWQLKQASDISLAEHTMNADIFCLTNQQDASLCTSLNLHDNRWRAQMKIQRLPLKLINPWLPADLELVNVTDGTADIQLALPDQLLADVHMTLPAGKINYPMLGGEKDQREYDSGDIQFNLNTQGLKTVAELTMSNGDHLLAQVALPGFNPLADPVVEQSLKARADLDAKDLRLIESLITDVHDLQGEFKLRLIASGTLDHPIISGQANIKDGKFQIPRLGLNIESFTLNSHSDNTDRYNYRFDAHSGDGDLTISGSTRLDRAAGWPTEINIRGSDFEASRTPEARLLITPDLQIKLKDRRIDIGGKVHIPYAKLQPKDVSRAETVSSDTVIIGGERDSEEKWLIHTAVRLTLGERIHFYGFGFEGRLGGNLLLQDEPGQLTSATGEITVPEGVYRAYGQRLEITDGRILYTGGPLTNPGLDLRAVRKVDTVTAGIHLKGSLTQPQLEIFSNPAMSQTDALSYIILGGPMEKASSEDSSMMAKAALAIGLSGGDTIARSIGDELGLDDMRIDSSDKGDQAALVVGRYLSPKLYASYGVGLLDQVNTLTLRYQISPKWQLKIESGGYQGADILYTIER